MRVEMTFTEDGCDPATVVIEHKNEERTEAVLTSKGSEELIAQGFGFLVQFSDSLPDA